MNECLVENIQNKTAYNDKQLSFQGDRRQLEFLLHSIRAGDIALWNRWVASNRFRRINLCGADFSHLDLSGVDLSNADLSYTSMDFCLLKGACLKKAVLKNATLRGADLSDADLADTDFQYANLYETRVAAAALLKASSLRKAFIKNIRFVDGAVMVA